MWKDKKAVIFDLDGTLVDSMWMWRQIDIEYLARYGIVLPEDLQKSISGMSFSETAVYFRERFQLPATPEQIKRDWNAMAMEKYTQEVTLKEGVREFLHQLKTNGIRTGIATSNSLELVTAVLQSRSVRSLFDEVHTSCEVKHGKPAPDIYLLVARCLGVTPQDCLVFEDIPEGILAGKAAGMSVCAVEDEFSALMREEKRSLADYYIDSYQELLEPDETGQRKERL